MTNSKLSTCVPIPIAPVSWAIGHTINSNMTRAVRIANVSTETPEKNTFPDNPTFHTLNHGTCPVCMKIFARFGKTSDLCSAIQQKTSTNPQNKKS